MLGEQWLYDYKKYGMIHSMKPHKYGFTVDNWNLLGINSSNCKEYLSNAQYCNMHPMNGTFSKWIDDKLTLKYLLAGTELNQYMPEYYFQIDSKGKLLVLPDYPHKSNNSFEIVAEFLKEKKEFAVKQTSGSIGEGFYKAEFDGEHYLLNGKELDEREFTNTIRSLRDYIIIEYLHPHPELAEYCPSTVNTIRFLAGRMGNELKMIKGYVRFGTENSGFIENYNAGGVLCYLDEDGRYYSGNVIDGITNKKIDEHPDCKKVLNGKIPLWDSVVNAVGEFNAYFPQLDYLGFDFVITSDEKVKILEINSLTSLDTMELDGSILNSKYGDFFRKRLK